MKAVKLLLPQKGGLKVVRPNTREYRKYRKAEQKALMKEFEQLVEKWNREKRKRVLTNYNAGHAGCIFSVEKAWKEYRDTDDFTKLYEKLQGRVKRLAEFNGKNWVNWRLSEHDFESVLWEEIWRIIRNYNGWTDFYLLETIDQALMRRCIDVQRRASKTRRGEFENGASSLESINESKPIPSNDNTEQKATNRVLVNQIINDPILTEEERRFIKIFYDNTGATFREIAEMMGYNHSETARRLLARVRKKLTRYAVNR